MGSFAGSQLIDDWSISSKSRSSGVDVAIDVGDVLQVVPGKDPVGVVDVGVLLLAEGERWAHNHCNCKVQSQCFVSLFPVFFFFFW